MARRRISQHDSRKRTSTSGYLRRRRPLPEIRRSPCNAGSTTVLGVSCTFTGSMAHVMWTGCRPPTPLLLTACMPLLSTSGNEAVTDIRLEFAKGAVTSARARTGNDALQTFLKSNPGASRFREFCLGFNPRLVVPPGESALPYYGYGSGVVRMSLGDNTELGGSVRGGVVRWLFFPDATVRVDGEIIVRDGRLQEH